MISRESTPEKNIKKDVDRKRENDRTQKTLTATSLLLNYMFYNKPIEGYL